MLIKHQRGESYQHAAARTIFVEWLRLKDGNFGPFKWRGYVWEEYPFLKDMFELWNETSINIKMLNPPIPTYDELIAANIYPVAIADILLSHKGMKDCIIEIVYKNDINEKKLAKLKLIPNACHIEIWRVEAHWILSQIGLPNSFPEEMIRRVG